MRRLTPSPRAPSKTPPKDYNSNIEASSLRLLVHSRVSSSHPLENIGFYWGGGLNSYVYEALTVETEAGDTVLQPFGTSCRGRVQSGIFR